MAKQVAKHRKLPRSTDAGHRESVKHHEQHPCSGVSAGQVHAPSAASSSTVFPLPGPFLSITEHLQYHTQELESVKERVRNSNSKPWGPTAATCHLTGPQRKDPTGNGYGTLEILSSCLQRARPDY